MRSITYLLYKSPSNVSNYGLNFIERHGLAPFVVYLQDPERAVDSIRIEIIHAQPAPDNPYAGVAFGSTDSFYDEMQQIFYVNGTIENRGKQPINKPLIIVTYYDATGTIICVASLRKMSPGLGVGETFTFHIDLHSGMCDLSKVKTFRLMVGRWGN